MPTRSAQHRESTPGLSRRDPAVLAIVRAWRSLTSPRRHTGRLGPGERTLVACSGGADSCALVVALAAATDQLVVAHIVHDLRPRAEALAGRDVARDLAERLGLEFVEAEVRVVGSCRNLESAAREARYAALAEIARSRGIRFIATAHHADDQLENVLMSLVRGTGAGGVRGMPRRRRLSNDITLVRPMLTRDVEVGRVTCRRLCDEAGVAWSEDATNADLSRLRAALRHTVIPSLRAIRPRVARRGVAAAEQADEVAAMLRSAARRVLKRADRSSEAITWPRSDLRTCRAIVLGEVLRRARTMLIGNSQADRVTKRTIDAAVRAIQDPSTEPRRMSFAGTEIRITARTVSILPKARTP